MADLASLSRLFSQSPPLSVGVALLQIEYIIVAFHDATKNAYLALSQTEILIKLAGVVMDMECAKESVQNTFASSAPARGRPPPASSVG